VYVIAAVITLHTSPPVRVAIVGALVAGHWAILRLAPMTPTGTIEATIDRAIFGTHILLPSGDPEGALGTLSAVASALVGSLAGERLRIAPNAKGTVSSLLLGGTLLAIGGYLWSFALPFNKPLWTGSYAIYTAGLAVVALAVCYWIVDVRGYGQWARPFIWLGLNPLAIYFLAELAGHLMDIFNVKTALYWGVLRPAIHPPLDEMATSFVFAGLTVALWIAVAGVMFRRDIRIQV
jgi:predicted acyltransferase